MDRDLGLPSLSHCHVMPTIQASTLTVITPAAFVGENKAQGMWSHLVNGSHQLASTQAY